MASGITKGLSEHGREAGWAGVYDCIGSCRRKRLIATEFSKKQIEKYQKDPDAAMTCKQCVEAKAADERKQAAARQAEKAKAAPPVAPGAAVDVSDGDGKATLHECASCKKQLDAAAYNRTQLSKGVGKQRCRDCVEAAEKAAASATNEKKEAALEEARKALAKAEISKDSVAILKASSTLAALEGEKVTGLKPIVLGKGRGRGRGGSWRGGGRS